MVSRDVDVREDYWDMDTVTANERARRFIDDVLQIYADHGIRSVESEEVIEAAVANAARHAQALAQRRT
jgi:hypothetical protein